MHAAPVRRLAVAAVAAASVLLCIGCEEKATAENFEKVTTGMSRSQVERLLGPGTDDTSSAGYGVSDAGALGSSAAKESVFIWRASDGSKYQVFFADGKVVQKARIGS